jgi:DNA modification methylase
MNALAVETWPLARLAPYARNARTHSDEQVAQIAASIAEFGFVNPVLVDEAGEIIAGHGRVMAAKTLGLEAAPVIVLGHLTDAQKIAFRIADNRLAENAGWDEELLAQEFASLRDLSFDLDLTGFDAGEIERMLSGGDDAEEEGLTDEDAVPEPEDEPVTKPGDLWIMGEHRLLCGDATVLADVERCLGGVLADMTFVDPPYRVAYEGKGSTKENRKRIKNDDLGVAEFERFLTDAMAGILAVTKGAIYVAMSSSELHTLRQAFEAAGGHWSTFIVWAKNQFTLGRSDYQRQYEPILYGWKKGVDRFWCGARDQGDVWFAKKPRANDLHPTMKPVELVERAVRNSSKSRDVVLDTFGGSGTTLIASEKLGRQARIVELDPGFCDVIVKRWQEFTGKDATLDGDGRSFAEIAGSKAPA